MPLEILDTFFALLCYKPKHHYGLCCTVLGPLIGGFAIAGRFPGGDKGLPRSVAQHESGGRAPHTHAAYLTSLQAMGGQPEKAALALKQALHQD